MKTKFLLVVLLLLSIFIGTQGIASAAAYDYKVDTTLTIAENFATSVTTVISATDTGNSSVPGSIIIPKRGVNISALTATTGDGGKITVSEVDGGLSLRLNTLQGGTTKDWSISVSYTTQIGLQLGQSFLVMVAPHAYADIKVVGEKVTILSSIDLGNVVTRGSKPTDSSTSAGDFLNSWENKTGSISKSLGLLFGDSSLASLAFTKTLENNSLWWKTQSVVLPPDTNQQSVFIDEIMPRPSAVRLDIDGNIILDYRLRPRQSIEVSAKARVHVNSYTYLMDTTLLVNDIEPSLVSRYTSLNGDWADTTVEIEGASELPVNELVEQIYKGVASDLGDAVGLNEYETSKSLANYLIGELRANGVPARLVIGGVFGDGANSKAAPVSHAWSEAYLPDVGWVTLDPSFEQNGEYFGVADVQRIALALRGYDPNFPPENLAAFNISFLDQDPPATPVMKPEIKSTKHVIFPGLALSTTNIQMPAGVIVDNVGVAFENQDSTALGSLAPYQNVNIKSLSLLASAFTGQAITYGALDTSGQILTDNILVQTTTNVSYVPMIGLILLAAMTYAIKLGIVKLIANRHENKKTKTEKTKKTHIDGSSDNKGSDIESIDMLEALDIQDELEVAPAKELSQIDPGSFRVRSDQSNNTELQAKTTRRAEPLSKIHSSANSGVDRPVQSMQLEKAHEVTPEEIRKELQRKRPPLIQ